MLTGRCEKCKNCEKVLRVQRWVLACANPPFSHANDDIVQVWNDTLKDFPCLQKGNDDGNSMEA